jgi:hypothetical protein
LPQGSGDAEGALHGEEPITLQGPLPKCSSAAGSSMVGFRANHAAKNRFALSAGFGECLCSLSSSACAGCFRARCQERIWILPIRLS